MDENLTKFIFSEIDVAEKIEVPVWKEVQNNQNPDVYTKFGENNRYPNMLQDLTEQSETASSVINGTVNMICGNAIRFNGDIKLDPGYMNRSGETLEDFVEQMAHDIYVYGGCYIQVIKNKLFEIAELYVLPFEMVRTNYNKTKFWFSKNWSRYQSNVSGKTIIYDAYDPLVKDQFASVLYFSNAGHRYVYPKSPLTSIFEDMSSEVLCAKYIKNNLQSGLAARYIVSLPNSNNLTDNQKDEIKEGFKANMCGVANAGQFCLYFNTGDKGLEITKVDADNANEMFVTLRDSLKDNIFIGLSATPQLFGRIKEGSGFNAVEYEDAYALYNKMIVRPIQTKIVRILECIFGTGNSIEIEPYTVEFKNNVQ